MAKRGPNGFNQEFKNQLLETMLDDNPEGFGIERSRAKRNIKLEKTVKEDLIVEVQRIR